LVPPQKTMMAQTGKGAQKGPYPHPHTVPPRSEERGRRRPQPQNPAWFKRFSSCVTPPRRCTGSVNHNPFPQATPPFGGVGGAGGGGGRGGLGVAGWGGWWGWGAWGWGGGGWCGGGGFATALLPNFNHSPPGRSKMARLSFLSPLSLSIAFQSPRTFALFLETQFDVWFKMFEVPVEPKPPPHFPRRVQLNLSSPRRAPKLRKIS